MKSRREIFEAHYRRYQQAGKKEKGKILEEVAGTTGLNRDHLAHVLASYGKKQTVTGETRPPRRKREAGRETITVSGESVCGPGDAHLGGSRAALRQITGSPDTGYHRLSCRLERT
jgi:hypothetical protein